MSRPPQPPRGPPHGIGTKPPPPTPHHASKLCTRTMCIPHTPQTRRHLNPRWLDHPHVLNTHKRQVENHYFSRISVFSVTTHPNHDVISVKALMDQAYDVHTSPMPWCGRLGLSPLQNQPKIAPFLATPWEGAKTQGIHAPTRQSR